MVVRFLKMFASPKKTFKIGDEADVTDKEAIKLVRAKIAEPKVKKAFDALLKKEEEAKAKALEDEKKVLAIQRNAELKKELEVLSDEILKMLDVLSSDDPAFSKKWLDDISSKLNDIG